MHMIDFSNNRANMAYVGETPWQTKNRRLNEKDKLRRYNPPRQ